jgi:hypothetical protein
MTDEEKRAKIVRMVMEKSPPGTDPVYIVKAASILYDYIHNNLLSDKQIKQNLNF